MSILKVNSTALPDPYAYKFFSYDVDSENSGRTASGKMFRERIAVKRKLSLEWRGVNKDAASDILSSITDAEMVLTFIDPALGTTTTMTCYVGDREVEAFLLPNTGEYVWRVIAFNFIEV